MRRWYSLNLKYNRSVAVPEHEVAGVGYEAYALAEDEDGVVSEDGVAYYYEAACQGYYPEACGEFRLAATAGVEPLVDEAEGEDYLAGGAVDYHPQGDVVIAEEAVDGGVCVVRYGYYQRQWQQGDDGSQRRGHFMPYALDVEVPDVDVIGDYLPDDYGEIVAQPAVEAKQA